MEEVCTRLWRMYLTGFQGIPLTFQTFPDPLILTTPHTPIAGAVYKHRPLCQGSRRVPLLLGPPARRLCQVLLKVEPTSGEAGDAPSELGLPVGRAPEGASAVARRSAEEGPAGTAPPRPHPPGYIL